MLLLSASLLAQTELLDSLYHSFYVYNQQQDTLFLDSSEAGILMPGFGSSFIDSLQIDGEGRKEIILYRSYSGFEERHGGSFDISERTGIGKYEIWNLDTKQLLFSCITNYHYDCHNFDNYASPRYLSGTCSFDARFSIDEAGLITIDEISRASNLKETYRGKTIEINRCNPDKLAGTYYFTEGRYQRKE